MSDNTIYEAIGSILKEQRQEIDAAATENKAEIDARIANLDGITLLKSATGQVITSNIAALQAVADTILLKKSTITAHGTKTPDLVKVVLK